MRHPRLTGGGADLLPLVAVAHGSKDPRAAATIGDLLSLVRARAGERGLAGLDVRAAFLDHCAPSPRQALSAVAGVADACVVLPLLLTAAYHSKTDIPAQIAAAQAALPRLGIRYAAGTLGPHPLLTAALERRLAEAGGPVAGGPVAGGPVAGGPVAGGPVAGARAATGVVLAAAGSTDPAANATIAALAARWRRDGGWRAVVPAYASAASPAPGEAVRALRAAGGPVVVATYLLAPGYFADKIASEAAQAGADVVSGALGAAPEVADVILDRYAAACRAAVSVVAKAHFT